MTDDDEYDIDELFGYIDETIDHLEAALAKAQQIHAAVKGTQRGKPMTGQRPREAWVRLARDMHSNISDADTAAENVVSEME